MTHLLWRQSDFPKFRESGSVFHFGLQLESIRLKEESVWGNGWSWDSLSQPWSITQRRISGSSESRSNVWPPFQSWSETYVVLGQANHEDFPCSFPTTGEGRTLTVVSLTAMDSIKPLYKITIHFFFFWGRVIAGIWTQGMHMLGKCVTPAHSNRLISA